MRILAIETTCDETSAAVLEDGRLLSNFVYTQIPLHSGYNGVVPELASRAHLEKMPAVLSAAIKEAGLDIKDKSCIDAVAFSRGPGLPGSLMVGRMAAETAAEFFGVPLIGVNHLEGHLLACEFEDGKISKPLQFPLIALLVSGGHTEMWLARDYGDYKIIGRTRDDAAGEAFDKVAKLLKLPYPGGPQVERLAAEARHYLSESDGKASLPHFPRPYMKGTREFSFSGLKTAVSYYLQKNPSPGLREKCLICREFQDAVIETLIYKVREASEHYGVKRIAIGGGVSANSALRLAFMGIKGIEARFSEKQYCSDNAAMITLCALRRMQSGEWKNSIKSDPVLENPSWKVRKAKEDSRTVRFSYV